VPNRNQNHYVWAGRILGSAVVLGGAWIALQFDTILQILKFVWEMNVMVAPAFWLGMKWRRANRIGAWTAIIFGALAFLVIPIALPFLAPTLRKSETLLKRTDPAPVYRSYVANEGDVTTRQEEIAKWEALGAEERAATPRPEGITFGQPFEKRYDLPRKSIFWTLGVVPDSSGQLVGKGALSLELVALDAVGMDLVSNPYALNETIRIFIRTFLPFLLMIVVSLLTKKDDEHLLNLFYARMRTKVNADREVDDRELALSLENVHRHADALMFPSTQWEFYKMDKVDVLGFLASIGAAIGVLLLMTFLVRLGS
jgi:SSS family solute:Na+ symporter